MVDREEPGYRNPAYIYDEGRSGGGPDTRSSSSVSSHSSMKMIGAKLKQQGRTRWLVLALIVLIAVLLIIGITVAVYFARNGGEDVTPLQQVGTNEGTTKKNPNLTTTIKTRATTLKPTTKRLTTRQPSTEPPKTKKPSTEPPTTQKATTERPKTLTPSTERTTTHRPPITTERDTTTLKPTTEKSTTPQQTTPDQTTQTQENDVTSTQSPNIPGNMTVNMNDILYNPTDVTSLTLVCEGLHGGKWETLTIRKQFKDGYEPIAIAVLNSEEFVEVFKLYPNITHIIDVTAKYVVLSLTLDPFNCIDLTNYTCALTNQVETVTATSKVSVFMPDPEVILPHSVVENNEVVLTCIGEVWGDSGTDVRWQFRPEGATSFMDFSVKPVTNITVENCTSHINSTLTFNITMFEDSATFRCEIVYTWANPVVIQRPNTDVLIRVVPSSYCEGKQLSTLHPHPHGPCTVAIFCHENGPLVYEIDCEPGFCYDYVKTACVPQDSGTNG